MATYRPDRAARWLVAVRGGVVLMAPTAAASELALLWPEMTADDPTPTVLDRLTAGGLAATPSFALVVRDADAGSARIVVRGDLVVHADGSAVSGSGVATWTERVVDSGEIGIRAPSDEDAADDAAWSVELPVVEAIVPAVEVISAEIEVVAPSAPAVAPEPIAASVAITAPEPIAESVPVATPEPIVPPAPPAAEQTIVPIEDTIVTPIVTARPAPVGTATSLLEGDHDGLTVASIDIRRLREERAARSSESLPSTAVFPSTPGAGEVPRSSLRMPDGSLEPIAHEVVLGRAPSVSQISGGGRLPRLITIAPGDPDISRNHLRITLEGDTVVVTDLHSRNGTHVVAPGKAPVKLRAGEPTPVLAGTVVDLGGGCTLQVVGA